MGSDEPARRTEAGGRLVATSTKAPVLVAKVLPDVAGFDKELDYAVPVELAPQLGPGSVVRVPLQGRRVRGWVLAFPVQPSARVALRPVAKLSSLGPEPALLELARWAAWRWAGRRRALLVTASAPRTVKALPPPALTAPRPPGPRGATTAELIARAWRPGTHILQLPPAVPAVEVVAALAQRGPVLVLAPTEARAEAGAQALRSRGAGVALLPGEWAQARAGARVVIGSRAGAWGPCPQMASVVVLDAHDEAYVQGTAPTWRAPDVVAERARRAGVPCFWATPCPTLELLAAASERWAPSRAEQRRGWAVVQVVDRRREDPRSGLYSRRLVALLRDPAQRVVCVLNRKGRAVLLDCAACGELVTCELCGAAVQMVGEDLSCRRCGRRRPLVCAKCSSTALRTLRPGVSAVRGELEALAGRPVSEVGTGPLPEARVLVGTEAVLYREAEVHRSGGASVVAFLDFDQELLAPRYQAGEEALALLARASRLVGGRPGTALVQTRWPRHPVLQAAVLADPARLAAAEEPVRKELRLPPFAALALVRGPGAGELAEAVRSAGPAAVDVELDQGGVDRWLLRAPSYASLARALAAAGRPKRRVRVEVGPARL